MANTVCVSSLFFDTFSKNEREIILRLMLNADEKGFSVFSDRQMSRITGISYQQVRTIHQKWLEAGVINAASNAPANAVGNAKVTHVTICNNESFGIFQRKSNAPTNAVGNAPTNAEVETLKKQIVKLTKEIEQLKKEKEELANASKKKTARKTLDLSSVAPDFIDVVTDWLEYKKERGESYKPKGFSSFYKKLIELSGGSSDKAQKIVEQSKSNNYAGIFQLRESYGNNDMFGMILKGDRSEILKNAKGWK